MEDPIDAIPNIPSGSTGSVLVLIIRSETKISDPNIENLQWAFADSYFITQVLTIAPPPVEPTIKTISKADWLENYYMSKALTYAAEGPYQEGEAQRWWNNLPCIIIKDSSVTTVTPTGRTDGNKIIGGFKERIRIALERATQANLFYLCKWNDLCNKYTDVPEADNIAHGTSLKWSLRPTATQAIMYRPETRDQIITKLSDSVVSLSSMLNNLISQGKLFATVFSPNLINYDVSLATDNQSYNKLNECAPVATETSNSPNIVVWFTVLAIIILIFAWALIMIGPTYNQPKKK